MVIIVIIMQVVIAILEIAVLLNLHVVHHQYLLILQLFSPLAVIASITASILLLAVSVGRRCTRDPKTPHPEPRTQACSDAKPRNPKPEDPQKPFSPKG